MEINQCYDLIELVESIKDKISDKQYKDFVEKIMEKKVQGEQEEMYEFTILVPRRKIECDNCMESYLDCSCIEQDITVCVGYDIRKRIGKINDVEEDDIIGSYFSDVDLGATRLILEEEATMAVRVAKNMIIGYKKL